MTRLIIDNIKDEYIPAFKGLADGTNATLISESSDECPICEAYNYDFTPSKALQDAIDEINSGGGILYKDIEEYKAKIDD